MATKKATEKRVTAVLDVRLWRKLRVFAKDNGILRSEAVLRAIKEYVDEKRSAA